MTTLMKSHESDTMSNRIVHISVQLFSNEELARHVTEECQLLDIMVTVLLYMMDSCLVKSELQGELFDHHFLHWLMHGDMRLQIATFSINRVQTTKLQCDLCTTVHAEASFLLQILIIQYNLLPLYEELAKKSFAWARHLHFSVLLSFCRRKVKFTWCAQCVSLCLPADEEGSRHVVVNCSEALLKNNTYWPLVSDFINILSHQSVAKKFLEDHSLLMLWMSFVSVFQGNFYLCFSVLVSWQMFWLCLCCHLHAMIPS